MGRLLVVIYEILMRNILPDNSDLFQLVGPDKKILYQDGYLSFYLGVPRLMAGRAFRSKSSPLVPRGCGLSTAIPHASV